jgi:hypothetical protein
VQGKYQDEIKATARSRWNQRVGQEAAGLRALFQLQDAVPEVGVASGIESGVRIALAVFEQLGSENTTLKTTLAKTLDRQRKGLCGWDQEGRTICPAVAKAEASRRPSR